MPRISTTIAPPAFHLFSGYCQANGFSYSHGLSTIVDMVSPALGKINFHYMAAKKTESELQKFFVTEAISRLRGMPVVSAEEHMKIMWENYLVSSHFVTPALSHQQKSICNTMSSLEIEAIKDELTLKNASQLAKKIIYIYAARQVDKRSLCIHGHAYTFFLKEITHDGNYFDVNHIQLLPISDLIIFGTEKTLERKNISIPYPCICWIDIFQINGLAVMVPIVRESSMPPPKKSNTNIIIINPFEHGAS